ncbi:PREDICTED: uncharacterized protein LOC104731108 isoform X2 [Camelina sativa]|uniref:Uncharacterized protein LOC104731108 isoform X2 n=1 Tax=Camelina sativa TaxID=90675 RepID=A0ABM1QS12_CAMSA|nr:PREDICTED: uncharacterized protein LOC104731108 isoform X2 [Camelina sativa]
MHIKTNHNLAETWVDDVSHLIHKILPEGNVASKSYYETEKLMHTLSMPYHRIDVCQNNCMIYWGDPDESLIICKFCEHPRYKPEKSSRKRASGTKRIPYKRMFYLPLSDRLKRLYLSERTASHIRWHAEHTCHDGKMEHPSDGKVWKHFQELYPEFASKSRNVYLGLCTDGFNPFGSSGVPGRNHPKRSLDVFLRPLIEELQSLWAFGVEAFDVSVKQNFNLKAVLMWTISDFPALGMLSGWTTHGRLSCPYCMEDTDAFQLMHGRKSSWFDCHRRFLPPDHVYRQNKRSFLKNNVVSKTGPHYRSGDEILEHQLGEFYGVQKTAECGGNGHVNNQIEGYGVTHQWHKHSIFWELPYWRTHLLRHCFDVMHIEKNFFDNIINTLLNVTGKTKDSINSRKDLVLYCDRKPLHLTQFGKAPIPIFRLSPNAKRQFLKWLKDVAKFPDGCGHFFP